MLHIHRHAQAIADEQDEINSWKLQLLTVVAKYIVKHIQELLIRYTEENSIPMIGFMQLYLAFSNHS